MQAIELPVLKKALTVGLKYLNTPQSRALQG